MPYPQVVRRNAKRAMLSIEGQCRGACSYCARQGETLADVARRPTIITKIADAGDVLGLNAVISNRLMK